VQVGLDAPRRVLLPDRPDVRRLLAALTLGRPAPPTTAALAEVLVALERADLLLDADETAGVPAAVLARHGSAGVDAVRRRAAARVLVDGPAGSREQAHRLLSGAGLCVVDADPTVVLLVAERELVRERTDPWLREGVTHLCVETHDGGITLGPLVVPGVTACLRCVDAHAQEGDPRRPVVVDQLARRTGSAPLDELTATLALAWAVRDLVLHAEGERPATWSATVDLDTAGSSCVPAPRAWPRHPHCGCAWDAWPARLASA
jgi:hypothetical protein